MSHKPDWEGVKQKNIYVYLKHTSANKRAHGYDLSDMSLALTLVLSRGSLRKRRLSCPLPHQISP